METPVVTEKLIEWLDKMFPPVLPMTDNPIDYYKAQGKKLVIDRLRAENVRQKM